jgi:hypothetical protein
MSLRLVNVMGYAREIHYRCGKCCYNEKRHYEGDRIDSPSIPEREKQRHKFIRELKEQLRLLEEDIHATEIRTKNKEKDMSQMRLLPE